MEQDLIGKLREYDNILIDIGRSYKTMQKAFEPLTIAGAAKGDVIGPIISSLMSSMNGKAAMCFDEARKYLYHTFPELGTFKEAFPPTEQ